MRRRRVLAGFLVFSLSQFLPPHTEPHHPMTTPEDQPKPSLQQIVAQMQQAEEQERRETTDRLRNEILPQFRALGVADIEVAYSGFGDSGAIDGVQYRGPTGVRVDRASIPAQLIEDVERCAYQFLPAGFEINDGGQGTLTIDVLASKVTIEHQENVAETRDSKQVFRL